METAALPDGVERFLRQHVTSVSELELLLLLHHQPERAFTAGEASDALRRPARWAGQQFERFTTTGLAVRAEPEPPAYRYGVTDRTVATIVDNVSRAFAVRRFSVVRAILTTDPASGDRLADAFRLRGSSD